jgi:hypothetical protein
MFLSIKRRVLIMDKKEFYVYRWYYINTNETFHIGKGKGQRYKEKKQSRN